MPWKNGGGDTKEIEISPVGASIENFDWRISMAHVAVSGPFSLFPGVDRTLSVIGGVGIALNFRDREAVLVDLQSQPVSFSGDLEVDGILVGGPIDDLERFWIEITHNRRD